MRSPSHTLFWTARAFGHASHACWAPSSALRIVCPPPSARGPVLARDWHAGEQIRRSHALNAMSIKSIGANRRDSVAALALAGGGMRGMWFGVPTQRRPECGAPPPAPAAAAHRRRSAHRRPTHNHVSTHTCAKEQTPAAARSPAPAAPSLFAYASAPRAAFASHATARAHRAPRGNMAPTARRQPPHDVDRLSSCTLHPRYACARARARCGGRMQSGAPWETPLMHVARCAFALRDAPLARRPSALAIDPTL